MLKKWLQKVISSSKNYTFKDCFHGTFESSLNPVLEKGFEQSVVGVFGKGTYFWYMQDYGKMLAKARVREKKADEASDESKGVTFQCSISTSEKCFFDATTEQSKREILEFSKEQGIINPVSKEEKNELYNDFFTALEEESQIKVLVIKADIPSPKEEYFEEGEQYPVNILGHPLCLIAKERDTIDIKKHETFNL